MVAAAETLPDGRLRLPGSMRVEEAARALGVAWSGYANTVGGFVIERLGRVPRRGETFPLDGLTFEVEGVHRNLITALRVRRESAGPVVPAEVGDG
jgi:CBS domain containing-hemolysin-like protein